MSKGHPTRKEIKAIMLLVENGWLTLEVTPYNNFKDVEQAEWVWEHSGGSTNTKLRSRKLAQPTKVKPKGKDD